MNIIGHRKIFYTLSAVFLAASIGVLAVWGLKFGIDFTGGSIDEVEFKTSRPSVGELQTWVKDLNLGEVRFQPSGEKGLLIRTRHLAEAEHQALLRALAAGAGGEESATLAEKRFDAVGPTIGQELKRKSLIALVLVIFLIVSYIAFAFRKVSQPVVSWKYGITTVAALVHDVIIPAGFFAVAGRFLGYEVDTLFVTAVLTILGFSVHDTIVVFDRIRENLQKSRPGDDFEELVNRSVNQTLARSINTSLTVLLALTAVYFFGGDSTKVFSLTLMIGIIAGTYSSIFIASPLLVTWHKIKSIF